MAMPLCISPSPTSSCHPSCPSCSCGAATAAANCSGELLLIVAHTLHAAQGSGAQFPRLAASCLLAMATPLCTSRTRCTFLAGPTLWGPPCPACTSCARPVSPSELLSASGLRGYSCTAALYQVLATWLGGNFASLRLCSHRCMHAPVHKLPHLHTICN